MREGRKDEDIREGRGRIKMYIWEGGRRDEDIEGSGWGGEGDKDVYMQC